MAAPENIQRVFRRIALKKAVTGNNRHKKLVNLGKALSVGILFEVPNDKVYQKIHEYILELQKKKIKVKALGYVREKHLASHFLPVLSFDFIYPKDISWYGKPSARCAQDFWSTDFDICINVGAPACFPLKYIATRSVSRLKVGPYTVEDQDYYDVMIQPEEDHDQVKFLSQAHEYLSILNPKENA